MSAATSFDVAAYVADPIEIRPATLDLETVRGLTPEVLAVLTHLWHVERSILDLLRDLLVTPTHSESRVTAFLNTWGFEQYWLSQSLAAVLEANDAAPGELAPSRIGGVLRFWDERLIPSVNAVRSNLLGEDVVAAQMTQGWLGTAVLDLDYRRLAEIEPRLAQLASAAGLLKARHLAFYADDARARLARSAQGRVLARRALERWQWPLVRYAGRSAVRPVAVTLYADRASAARLRAIDATVSGFPGLAGLAPVRRALGRLAPRR